MFLEESQRHSASSRERGVGEGDARLKHTPRSAGSFSSCGEEGSALRRIMGWQSQDGRVVQLCLVHPTLSLVVLPHPGPRESEIDGGG